MQIANIIAVGFAALFGGSGADSTACVSACETVVTTDFRGKPPFKRKVETLPVANVAQVELINPQATAEQVTIRTVDFGGRPPFRRNIESLTVINVAPVILQEDQDGAARHRRVVGNSIFKRR